MHMNESVIAVDIREAARRLSVSPRTVATLVARNELTSLKVGRRRIIPVSALNAFLDSQHLQGLTRDDAKSGKITEER